MNITTPPSDADISRLWLRAWHQLQQMADVAITREDIDNALAALPKRLPNESLADWLRRGAAPVEADFLRMAASAGDELFPLLRHPLESADGRFRLAVAHVGDGLEITIQALGMAIDEFAFCGFDLVAAETGHAFANLTLDFKGGGKVQIADNEANRRALLHVQLRRRA